MGGGTTSGPAGTWQLRPFDPIADKDAFVEMLRRHRPMDNWPNDLHLWDTVRKMMRPGTGRTYLERIDVVCLPEGVAAAVSYQVPYQDPRVVVITSILLRAHNREEIVRFVHTQLQRMWPHRRIIVAMDLAESLLADCTETEQLMKLCAQLLKDAR